MSNRIRTWSRLPHPTTMALAAVLAAGGGAGAAPGQRHDGHDRLAGATAVDRGGNDHAHAHLGDVEETTGKFERQADAAVRSRMPRQHPAVERDARPGEALHVGHERVVVEVRIVLRLFFEDAKDAGGRFAAFLAGRYRRAQYPAFGVVDRDLLALQ